MDFRLSCPDSSIPFSTGQKVPSVCLLSALVRLPHQAVRRQTALAPAGLTGPSVHPELVVLTSLLLQHPYHGIWRLLDWAQDSLRLLEQLHVQTPIR